MTAEVLAALREAGRVAAAAREMGARLIVPGAPLREVCEAVEDEIRRRGAGLAFPAQTSRNHVAAHYCPPPEDETVYAEGDLAKLDIGVQVDGWVVDTAATVSLGDQGRLVDAARHALEAAIATAGPGVPIRRVSAAIESTLRAHGARPMKNLCGHHVGRWTVHSPPPIPNSPDGAEDRLAAGAVLAIEPFATDGLGFVVEQGPPEVFRLPPEREAGASLDQDLLASIAARRGLPFSRRDLKAFPRSRVEETLAAMLAGGRLAAYAPLVEASGRMVAQAEHTLYVGPEGVEVLTR
ncbi:MAG TPA: type II methionyl aminopeptidase [Vicinamibacteria bacterium]|nr:type II methionyl aminopeptidase [Vicinamibacteria bacterium]